MVRLARFMRLPVAALGLFMVWSTLFASDVVRPWMGSALWWLAGLQGGFAVLLWLSNALDSAGGAGPRYRGRRTRKTGESASAVHWFGRSPIGWAVIAYGVLIAPEIGGRVQQPALGAIGWTWAMLFCAVTLVSNRID